MHKLLDYCYIITLVSRINIILRSTYNQGSYNSLKKEKLCHQNFSPMAQMFVRSDVIKSSNASKIISKLYFASHLESTSLV